MKVTLSFDNGPHPEVTPAVLDVLARHDLRAHFFVLGQHIATDAGRTLVERMSREGHLVGNHSYTHTTPLGDDPRPDAVEREIGDTEALLDALVPGPRRFRPFGGGGLLGPHLLSERAVSHLCERGYSCILWNSVPRDWVDPQGWPTAALADATALAHTVLVLHDIPGASLDRLDDFIRQVKAHGGTFTTEPAPACVPIVAGRVVTALDSLVRRPGGPPTGGIA